MNLLRFLWQHARLLSLLSGFFSILGGLTTTGLLVCVNHVLGNSGKKLPFILVFITLAVATMIFRSAAGLLLAGLSQDALFSLRMDLSRQILNTPLRHLEETGSDRILAVLTDDIPSIAAFVTIVPILCTNGVIAATCLFYMGVLSAKLLGLVLLFFTLGVAIYEYLNGLARRHFTHARDQHTALLAHFRALIGGLKELKLHRRRREVFLSRQMHGTASKYQEHMLSGLRIHTGTASVGELLMFLVIGLTLFIPVSFIHANGGTVAAFVVTLLYLVGPLETIIGSAPQLNRANVALNSVTKMGMSLSQSSATEGKDERELHSYAFERLELQDVTFCYGGTSEESFMLGPLNLSCTRGEIVFLVGGNGSGKTTLAKLIVGLYKPDSGSIIFNRQEITDELRDSYRQMFSAVFADFYLFETLVGLDSPNRDETANQYLAELQLSEKVRIANGALSTTDLSQGQRKRLALLTAYLEDRPFYLFDEWAADQDPSFRQIFYHKILPDLKSRGKTVFVISHDDSYFSAADQIFKLDFGKVAQEQVDVAVL